MTCIIGHKDGWMVSDSRAQCHDRVFAGSARKIYRLGNHTLIGVAGNAGFDTLARQAIADAAEDVARSAEVLSDWVNENQHDEWGYLILLVNNRHELVEIDSTGAVLPVDDKPFWCIGSGGEVAQAYLEGVLASSAASSSFRGLTPALGEAAIKYTASALTSVDDRCQTYTLNG